jgi:hypothetical protein
MAFVSLRQLLDHAAEHDYGVPAFNINNMEQLVAIMAAAEQTASPVIIQASRGARAYAGEIMLRKMFEAAVETWPTIPVCIHLDHGDKPATCLSAIQSGFTSVMMDGSWKRMARRPPAMNTTLKQPPRSRNWLMRLAFLSKGSLAASVRWKPAMVRKRTDMALKAFCHASNC